MARCLGDLRVQALGIVCGSIADIALNRRLIEKKKVTRFSAVHTMTMEVIMVNDH